MTIRPSALALSILLATAPAPAQHQPDWGHTVWPLGPTGKHIGIRVADHDGDGDLEFYRLTEQLEVHDTPVGGIPGPLLATQATEHTDWSFSDLVVGDLNGDGRDDLVVADRTFFADEGKLRAYLSDGAGAFDVLDLDDGASPADTVALDDLDGDGVLDLILLRPLPNRVAVRLGLGDGTFNAGTTRPLTPGRDGLVTGDFDGDGVVDVLAFAEEAQHVDVCLGSGTGTLGPAATYVVPLRVANVASIDTDLDGFDDAVCTAIDAVPGGLVVLHGSAQGDLAPGPNQLGGLMLGSSSPYDLLPATDLDRDGIVDLVAHDRVLLGTGNGTFLLADTLPKGNVYAAADMDGDGAVDLLGGSVGGMVLARGAGDGTFSADSLHAPLGVLPDLAAGRLAAADMNGDGIDDAILSTYAFTQSPSVLVTPGLPGGGFAAPVVNAIDGGSSPRFLFGDRNADGHQDILLSRHSKERVVLLGDGAGGLTVFDVVTSSHSQYDAQLGDVDGDGVLDLLARAPGGDYIACYRGTANGGLGLLEEIPAERPISLDLADLDLDGDLDLVHVSGTVQVSYLASRTGAGDGTFGPEVVVPTVAQPYNARLGDVFEDGVADVVLEDWGAPWTVFAQRGLGPGGFEPVMSAVVSDVPGPDELELRDVDGDGHLDAFRRGPDLTVARGDGLGAFVDALVYSAGDDPVVMEMGAAGRFLASLDPDDAIRLRPALEPSPWTGLGDALAGADGAPSLLASGSLMSGDTVTLELRGAATDALSLLVLGFEVAAIPFKGGTMVPDPFPPVLLTWLQTTAQGAMDLPFAWPASAPSGTTIVVQQWVQDAGAPAGWSASNATVGVSP